MTETMPEDKTIKTSSLEERLKRIEEKKAQLENRKKAIIKSHKKQERAKRTQLLIRKGGMAEKYFDCKDTSPEEFEELLRDLFQHEAVKEFVELRKKKNKTWTV